MINLDVRLVKCYRQLDCSCFSIHPFIELVLCQVWDHIGSWIRSNTLMDLVFYWFRHVFEAFENLCD